MMKFHRYFKKGNSVIGMIHVDGLPGAPKYNGNTLDIVKNAMKDAEIYLESGVDAVLVENMHDVPYIRSKDLMPETTAMMTRICTEIRKTLPNCMPCGVQVLAGCNKEALAVAQAANFQFIRAEGFVFSHIADEGFIDGSAGNLLRYRKKIGADDILIFTDLKKKHSSHAITSDISLTETAKAAEFFLSDGIVITGFATGCPANKKDLKAFILYNRCEASI
ncbi:uncharacterized protein F13E9.13, mitochondrial isoform X2 [Prorops nasuta]|uniref:uncharacterized protein F13E9.13, mitochondrial isoform X2 n=1 Tax=Prorops nasuta TaxID=863751 RepID=UPI0034CDFDAB